VIGWFASWHTFLPVVVADLLGKPSILIIGGYDIARLPEIGYGHQRGGLKAVISRLSMKLAPSLVTNSHYSSREAVSHAGLGNRRINVIHHGLPDVPLDLQPDDRAKLVLTVGNVEMGNLHRKGHEPFVRAAAKLPEIEFVVVGAWKDEAVDYLRSIATPNVRFTGRVSDEELSAYYRRAAVYVQPSLHEGFGLSVAEAMLAGCIPVVTRFGALPEVVGDCGVYADSPSPSDVARAVEEAMSLPPSAREDARQRILTEFPMDRRATAIYEIIDSLVTVEDTPAPVSSLA
jgi:glycosyltransferase involved in cell wall biosynthesis